MQLSSVVILLIASIVCASCASTEFVASVAYTTSTCTGAVVGGSAALAGSCTQNGTASNYLMSTCNSDNSVLLHTCVDSACASCTPLYNISACAPQGGGYVDTKCYTNTTAIPAPSLPSFIQSTYMSSTCATAALVALAWAPTATCIPNYPAAGVSSMFSCSAADLTATMYASNGCTGDNTVVKVPISPVCGNGTVGTYVNAVCVSQSLTTGTTSHNTTATSTSTSTTTGTGAPTGTSTGATTAAGTTSGSAAVIASTLFVVAALMIAAL